MQSLFFAPRAPRTPHAIARVPHTSPLLELGEHSLTSSRKSSIAFPPGTGGPARLGATGAAPSFAQGAPGWYPGGKIGRDSAHFGGASLIAVPPATVTGSHQED